MPSLRPLVLGCAVSVALSTIGVAGAWAAPSGHAVGRTAAARTAGGVSAQSAPTTWVNVSVATVWVSRHKPRQVDRPALDHPARITTWLHHMTVRQRVGLDSRLDTQVLYGEPVVLLRSVQGWSRIRIPDQTGAKFPDGIVGWVPSRQLVSSTATASPAPTPATAPADVVTVTSRTAPLTEPASGAEQVLPLSYGTSLPLVSAAGQQVAVDLPGGGVGQLPAAEVSVHPSDRPALRPTSHHAVAQAERFRGLAYLWAGDSAYGFDCSGLVSSVYRQLGVTLPRDALDQSRVGPAVSRSGLRPADLVFFSSNGRRSGIHHVAMYVGHGRIVQAPFTGAAVSLTRLWHFGLTSQFWGATRPLAAH
jgi:cell wall-associated NlpC family hydrolase